MRFHDPAGDVQAQPETALPRDPFAALELAKNAILIFALDPGTVVFHHDPGAVGITPDEDGYGIPFAVLGGVAEQVW
jgi:hypothetical protein